ncbi:Amino acid ABC transporter substrate-binding protein [Rhodovastum atsumiense]|uniref:Amino acid ABC transporter substrate-binding protein n=1 Tax=Rhodovastum atsumiense TaxID=504468 RepID=A0A5M6IJV2_9PROT|nr:transporter substrate-binding domain-containing protein [Rhodovastum atsumiense]KAA5607858.1 amino acid ABC transporter substrate-binding protein [Rhodovastum atsumiense]CAH2602269.1 Amino acid ABC transporter substrate-binding protein [Rhodovastum atsumiense]
MFRAMTGLLLGLAIATASPARAGERILIDEANPPFMYADAGKPAGIYNALISEAFRRIGLAADMSAAPWKRAIAGLDAAENGVGGIYSNAERQRKYDFSDKLFDEVIVVYVPKARAFGFSGVDSLKGKTVGVIRGWSYGDDFDAAVKAGTIRTEETASDASNFAKLALGRIDAVLAIREAGKVAMAAQGVGEKVTALDPPLSSNPSFLAFSRQAGKGELLGRFNTALGAMRRDGSFERITAAALAK